MAQELEHTASSIDSANRKNGGEPEKAVTHATDAVRDDACETTAEADASGASESDLSDPASAAHPAGVRLPANQHVEMIAVSALKPHPRNARKHSRKQTRQIAQSITRFGFVTPVLIDGNNQIVAGHGRVEAAKTLKLTEVPTLRLEHMSENEVRAYVIADNKLAELAGWDHEILAAELDYLVNLDFEVEAIGFEVGEIDLTLADADAARAEAAGPEDQIPKNGSGPVVSREGDLWLLGPHRLVCGDARDGAPYDVLLAGGKANFVITDPPFNVAIAGHASRSTQNRDRDFPMANGEMSSEEFTEFLATTFRLLALHSEDGSIHDVFVDWRHVGEMLSAGRQVYSELKNICVWAKHHYGMGSFYRSQHELVCVWKVGQAPHINNLPFGPNGRSRSNLWQYPMVMRAGQSEEYGYHPTVKPVALIADAIKDCSPRGGIVLDVFVGSGTTVIAAERTGRRARGIEVNPFYVDTTVRRWQAYTGKAAILAATGQSFEEVEAERAQNARGELKWAAVQEAA